MNENENLNTENQGVPKEQTMDYSFDFSNQVSSADSANAPQQPVAQQQTETLAVQQEPQQPQPVQMAETTATVPSEPETMAQTVTPVEPAQPEVMAQTVAPVEPAAQEAIAQTVMPVEPAAPEAMPQTVAPVEPAQPEVMAPVGETPVLQEQPAIEQMENVVPVQPQAEPVQQEAIAQTVAPVEPAAPEVMAPLDEPQVVQADPAVEANTAPQEVAEATQTTEQPKAEKAKSWKKTLIFGAILLVIVALFIIILPLTQRIGG